ncbi:hypothetical protein [Pseudomonas fulva]|uniref:hypothetical protein n=1 Tax=Pseudomonas fulva TaxID=47880 RepID=UPI001F424D66|nr:hypothetical protein [Pseudomonas fulva]
MTKHHPRWTAIFFAAYLTLSGLSGIAANLSTAFPPPPSATLTVPIIIAQCPSTIAP